MRILITEAEDYNKEVIAAYSKVGQVTLLDPSENFLQKDIADINVLVVRLKYQITSDVIKAAPNLKYIISPTTGLDHIDEQCARENGIQIISLKGAIAFLESIPSTAELTWGLLLALVRNIPIAFNDVIAGHWNRQMFRGNNLKGKKLGILGLGRVGKQVAKFALAFDMPVIAYDPYQEKWLQGVEKIDSVEDLLQSCEILTIHIPSTGNYKFVSASLLRYLKKGAFIINTSRGSVWDEEEVAKLLLSGYLGGVATDVVSDETDETKRQRNPLITQAGKLKNLIITPHIAGATFQSMHATEEYVACKFFDAIKSVPLSCAELAAL